MVGISNKTAFISQEMGVCTGSDGWTRVATMVINENACMNSETWSNWNMNGVVILKQIHST